jgi:hypothetical protein
MIVRVTRLRPHPKADNLELAKTKYGELVVGKGEFRVGSTAVYVPVGSKVPVKQEEFDFLRPSSRGYHRVKSRRIRGVESNGLLVPNNFGLPVGSSALDWLGVIPPIGVAKRKFNWYPIAIVVALLATLIAYKAFGYEGQQCSATSQCANGEVCVKYYNVGKCVKVVK